MRPRQTSPATPCGSLSEHLHLVSEGTVWADTIGEADGLGTQGARQSGCRAHVPSIDRLKDRLKSCKDTTLAEMLEERVWELEKNHAASNGSLWIDGRDGSNWRILSGAGRAGHRPRIVLQRPHRVGPNIDRRVPRDEFEQHFRCIVP